MAALRCSAAAAAAPRPAARPRRAPAAGSRRRMSIAAGAEFSSAPEWTESRERQWARFRAPWSPSSAAGLADWARSWRSGSAPPGFTPAGRVTEVGAPGTPYADRTEEQGAAADAVAAAGCRVQVGARAVHIELAAPGDGDPAESVGRWRRRLCDAADALARGLADADAGLSPAAACDLAARAFHGRLSAHGAVRVAARAAQWRVTRSSPDGPGELAGRAELRGGAFAVELLGPCGELSGGGAQVLEQQLEKCLARACSWADGSESLGPALAAHHIWRRAAAASQGWAAAVSVSARDPDSGCSLLLRAPVSPERGGARRLVAVEAAALAPPQRGGAHTTGMHHRLRLAALLRALPFPKVLVSSPPGEGSGDPREDWEHAEAVGASADCAVVCAAGGPGPTVGSVAEQLALEVCSVRGGGAEGLLADLGCAPAQPPPAAAYLSAKVAVDGAARSGAVRAELVRRLAGRQGGPLRVLDLGAGALSMVRVVCAAAAEAAGGCAALDYAAVEQLDSLSRGGLSELLAGEGAALRCAGGRSGGEGLRVVDEARGQLGAARLRLAVLQGDAMGLAPGDVERVAEWDGPPDLVVACAFADLFRPEALCEQLHRLAPGALCYLPVTFSGRTWFEPLLAADCGGGARCPGDAEVAHAYHAHLREVEGQHIDPAALRAAFRSRGAALLADGPSDWRIDPDEHPVMWQAMMGFLSRGAPGGLWPRWAFSEWAKRRWASRPTICASNEDLLFELGRDAPPMPERRALVFAAPRDVRVEPRPSPPPAPGQVSIAAECSLISSGTELKFWRGDFEADPEPLDSAIAGMGGAMRYPLEYGYSLCGEVSAVGAGVGVELLGQRVFAFHAHASRALAAADSVLRVPAGIAAEDAVYLPAVETALSIAHDAHPRYGESVLVVGQGLIGLLVTALLSRSGAREVEAVEPDRARRAWATRLGATSARRPSAPSTSAAAASGGFDVTIDVTGRAAGLQLAIDSARRGGRVVAASWLSGTVALELGTRFHRSQLTLVASQVSELPAAVRGTWDKERRFAAAWDVIAELRPSRMLTTLRVPLEEAAAAYPRLAEGAEVAVQIDYRGAEAAPRV
eukprot:TRINITY_DN4141_c6_g1_i2.p1 TRINITY_DN4141_c6_g1~~TRINITY_DN4141_c6_g1_i2.p1  ORF type:complete len:1113 (+),score=311.98 TRINITY_DN4141_c6_g1_i2:71-3340(+)